MSFIDELASQRAVATAAATQILNNASAQNRRTLNAEETRRFDAYRADIERCNDRIAELGDDMERRSQIESNPVLARLSGGGGGQGRRGGVNTAGQLSPLHCPEEELRRLHNAAQRGEQASYEKRFTSADSLLPPELFPFPIGRIHENRLLDRLPGYATELPSIEFVQHISTTGSAESVAEGALKPEVTLNVDKLLANVVKLSAHLALSTEIRDDWDSFSQYATAELYKIVIDVENAQLLYAAGAGTDMTGFYSTPGILTHDCTLDAAPETVWDSLEKSIAALRSGSALAEPDLIVMHPEDWSHTRRIKDGYQRYLVSADPSTDQVNQAWGIDVLVTTQNPLGQALLIDTTKFGQVAIRSPLSLRVGWANDDLIRNLWRYVAEERLVLTVTRPAAVLSVTNLPAPTTTTTSTTTAAKDTGKK